TFRNERVVAAFEFNQPIGLDEALFLQQVHYWQRTQSMKMTVADGFTTAMGIGFSNSSSVYSKMISVLSFGRVWSRQYLRDFDLLVISIGFSICYRAHCV